MMDDNDFKSRLAATRFVVEATNAEMHFLWTQYSDQSPWTCRDWPRFKIEQMNPGLGITLGNVDKRPVVMSVSWWKVNGVIVMFHELVSQIADHAMEDKWLNENCSPRWDSGTRRAHCDAMNFHHVIDYVRNESQAQ